MTEDSRKMHQAEKRTTKKRKPAFPRKSSSTFSSAARFHSSNLGNLTPPCTANQCQNAFLLSQKQTLYNHITSGDFKIPRITGTTMENLAIGNAVVAKRTLSSKLDVNPNKTEKMTQI